MSNFNSGFAGLVIEDEHGNTLKANDLEKLYQLGIQMHALAGISGPSRADWIRTTFVVPDARRSDEAAARHERYVDDASTPSLHILAEVALSVFQEMWDRQLRNEGSWFDWMDYEAEATQVTQLSTFTELNFDAA